MTTKFEYVDSAAGAYSLSQATVWDAQTFTPSVPHVITSVKLLLFRTGSPGTMTVSIRATDVDGKPTGADLCSGTTNGNTLTTDTAAEWREITFSPGATLKSGVKYAIVVRAPDAGGIDGYYWKRTNAGYAGGAYWRSGNSGATWSADTGDCDFEDWGAPQQGGMFALFS